MGIVDFFRRLKRSKPLPVKKVDPSPEQILFAEKIMEIMGPRLDEFGFRKQWMEIEEYFSTLLFRKGKQYVRIMGTTFPTDYPYHFNILLGEGDSEDFLEWDWNSLPLWRIKAHVDPDKVAMEYEFPFGDKLDRSILHAQEELLYYGGGFLQGDLTLFYELRKEQNRNREPYQVHRRGKDGKYYSFNEPDSVVQKRKYS